MNTIIIFIIAAALLISAVVFLSFYFLNRKLDLLLSKPVQEQQFGDHQQLMAYKIQAYERIILYIERIELEGLVMRTFLPEMTVQQLQAALFRTIREEFEHNATQQLYVSERAWECTKGARALVLAHITKICQKLAPTDNGMQLAQALFTCVQDKEVYNYETFPLLIKREMGQDIT